MMMRSALHQTNTLSWNLQCQLTETMIRGQTCHSTQTHYSDSESTGLCSFSLMLRAQRRSNKYQFYSLWFDPTGARTHDLQHSRRACEPLRHRWITWIDESHIFFYDIQLLPSYEVNIGSVQGCPIPSSFLYNIYNLLLPLVCITCLPLDAKQPTTIHCLFL